MNGQEITVRCEDCRRKVALANTQSVFVKDESGEEARKTVCNQCAARVIVQE